MIFDFTINKNFHNKNNLELFNIVNKFYFLMSLIVNDEYNKSDKDKSLNYESKYYKYKNKYLKLKYN